MAKIDLSERPQRREDLVAWYSDALAAQEASGLSVAEVAARLDVAPTTLYQWKRRLARTTPSPAERRVKRSTPEGLIQLTLPQQPAPTHHAGFVVRLAGGRRVEVPDDFDDEVLQRLLSVLERC